MKYTDEELELLDGLEQNEPETVDFDNEAIKAMAGETLDMGVYANPNYDIINKSKQGVNNVNR